MILQIWKHVLKSYYGHVNINRVNSFNNRKKKIQDENKIREENWRRNKFKVWRPCWKNIVAEKVNHIKISGTLLCWGLERQETWSGSRETPRKTEPFCNRNHTKPKGSRYFECQSLPGRVGREEENSSRHLRSKYVIAKWTYRGREDICAEKQYVQSMMS